MTETAFLISTVVIPRQTNNVKKNEVVRAQPKKKDRKAFTKSAIYPENQFSRSSPPTTTPQKSLSLTNLNNDTPATQKHKNGQADPITISTTFNMASNGNSVAVSDTEYKKSTEEHNGVVTEKVAVVTNSHLYTSDHDVTKEQHNQKVLTKVSTYDEDRALTNGAEYMSSAEMSYLKPTSIYGNSVQENGLNDQSTLIFMTQHSSRSSSIDRNMEIKDINFTKSVQPLDANKIQEKYNDTEPDGNFSLNFVPNKTTVEDETEYFKINVVKHDLNRTYSNSEDEQSHEEEEPRFTRMGYSSQAASIFFGEGNETEIVRPRRIQFTKDDDDDERRSSGADC